MLDHIRKKYLEVHNEIQAVRPCQQSQVLISEKHKFIKQPKWKLYHQWKCMAKMGTYLFTKTKLKHTGELHQPCSVSNIEYAYELHSFFCSPTSASVSYHLLKIFTWEKTSFKCIILPFFSWQNTDKYKTIFQLSKLSFTGCIWL